MITGYIITLSVMSLLTIIIYGIDKLNSLKNGARVPEIVLISFSALGGVLGTLLGMLLFNHKSNLMRKWYFFTTIIVSLTAQLLIALICLSVF